jgi:hypothetical protein
MARWWRLAVGTIFVAAAERVRTAFAWTCSNSITSGRAVASECRSNQAGNTIRLSHRPRLLLLLATAEDFTSFAASFDEGKSVPEGTRRSAKATFSRTTTPRTWQEDLEELLDVNPLTPMARRQELLSSLVAENQEIRASLEAAIRNGKVRLNSPCCKSKTSAHTH